MSQKRLGELAGYGDGANVSISRIELGSTRPTPAKLAGIAEALDTTVQELEKDASDEIPVGVHHDPGDSKESTRQLGRRLQQTVDERVAAITASGNALDAAHAAARDEFFSPFVEVARTIADTPIPPAAALPEDEDDDLSAADQAALRIRIETNRVGSMLGGAVAGGAAGAAAGGAAAYATFIGAVTFGTASTGAAISGLSGVAATNAALAALGGGSLAAGGAGIAGGTALLAGIVAAPIAILGVGGLIWMARRNKKQERELHAKLDVLAAELDAAEPGYTAVIDAIGRATEILTDISLYAGRALKKWSAQVDGLTDWPELGKKDVALQERYEAFNTIAACQVAIVTIDFMNFMTLRDNTDDPNDPAPLSQHIEVTNQLLTQARKDVDRLV